MKKLHMYFTLGLFLFFASCAAVHHGDMSRISLGMSKEAVIDQIGRPNMVVSAQATEDGPLEVYEYLSSSMNTFTSEFERRAVWVYFLNNEVVEWGPGQNDWQFDSAIAKRMLQKYRERKENYRHK